MTGVLLAASVLLGTAKIILSRCIKRETTGTVRTLLSDSVFFLIAGTVVTLAGLSELHRAGEIPFGLAAAFAGSVFLGQISLMLALQYGSVSLSSLFSSCGFIVPSLWGWLRFDERAGALQIVGLAAVLAAFILAADFKTTKQFNWKWLVAAIGAMFFAGTTGVVQKEFAAACPSALLEPFLSVSLLSIAVLCALGCGAAALFVRYRGKTSPAGAADTKDAALPAPQPPAPAPTAQKKRAVARFMLFAFALGVVLGFLNLLNTYLAGVLPSIVVFPVYNGGIILVSTLCSALLFRERLSVRGIVSLALGLAAILLIAFG